jgi:SEC-C motif-containing protein
MAITCPCGSGNAYDTCCGPFLGGRAVPATAEQLMRSRYTAYARQNANYLVATTHPSKRARNELKVIGKSFRGITWVALDIIATEKGSAQDSEGTVEFKAHCTAGREKSSIHERSSFVREGDRWFYFDGDIIPANAGPA